MTKEIGSGDFIRKRIREQGRSIVEIAKALGVKSNHVYQCINRGRFPKDIYPQLAKELHISIEDLQKAGIQIAQKRAYTDKSDNIFPLLKSIVGTGEDVVTANDLRFLKRVQTELNQEMSPNLINELLAHRREDRKSYTS